MALHLKHRSRVHDAPKKAITVAGFREALQARKLAELKSKAKSQARAQAEEEEHANGHLSNQEAEQLQPMNTDASAEAAATPMEVDVTPESPDPVLELQKQQAARLAARQSRKEERDRRKHFRLDEKAKRKAKELADLTRQWEQGEQERLGRLQAIAQARQNHTEKNTTHEQQIAHLQGELAEMNERKSKLIAQLKQVLLVEEVAQQRALALENLEEGEFLPSPLQAGASTSYPYPQPTSGGLGEQQHRGFAAHGGSSSLHWTSSASPAFPQPARHQDGGGFPNRNSSGHISWPSGKLSSKGSGSKS